MNTILTRKYLEHQYLTLNREVRDIAQRTGYSYSYLQTKIKNLGIPRRRRYKDLCGQRFGKLVVQEFSELDSKKQARWKCLCDCGNFKITKGDKLQCGDVKSCGCIRKVRVGDISGSHFSNIKAHARHGDFEFSISNEEIWKLYLKQNRRCALSGVEIKFNTVRGKTTASLDRIDSSRGYTLDNVQWVHKDVNQMKSDRTVEDFLKWVNTIASYQSRTN